MTQQISTTETSTFFPCCAIQMAHTKRTSAIGITDYICIKGDQPMTMSHLKVTAGSSDSLTNPKIELSWHDDSGDLFFLKHKSLTSPIVTADKRYDMSRVEQAMLEWTKTRSLHVESTFHGSSDSSVINIITDEHEDTDIHAALDCLAYLDNDGMIDLTSLNNDSCAFTSRTQIISTDGVNELTTAGLRIDETAMLIYDYPISRQLLESIFLNDEFIHSLSRYELDQDIDLFILASYAECSQMTANAIGNNRLGEYSQGVDYALVERSVLKNTITVLDRLISNKQTADNQTTVNKTS